MKCHISHLMLVDLNIHPLLQDLLQYLRHLEFAVKKHLDIIRQRIADLLMIPDTSHCKGNMISKGETGSFCLWYPQRSSQLLSISHLRSPEIPVLRSLPVLC